MAKMTLSGLQTAVAAYIVASKQAGTWTATTGNIIGLVDKIGKIITIDGSFNNKLEFLKREDLPFGKTVEEYYIDLTLPEAFTGNPTGSETGVSHYPTMEAVTYNYALGRKKIPTTVPFGNIEYAVNNEGQEASIVSNIMKRLYDSQSLYEYAICKNLVGNLATKAIAASSNLYTALAIPSDETTGEAFIKAVKNKVEDSTFPSEVNNLGQYLMGASEELTLFVKKGITSILDVDTLAGAFHTDKLAIPARVVVLDDFGAASSDVYAILADTRGLGLHPDYRAVRSELDASGDKESFILHTDFTARISKSTFVHVFKKP